MKSIAPSVANLYLLVCTLLATHEIDSGYWQEWNLFGIPGGNQLFLVLNFILVLVALYGYKQVLLASDKGFFFSALLATGGAIAFVIHSVFILLGRTEFTDPVSLIVLGALFVVSMMLARTALEQRREAK